MSTQRENRLAQAKHRGSKQSIKTDLENVQMLLAWEFGDLTEGQLSKLLNVERVTLRKMRDNARAAGMAVAESLDREGQS